MGKKALVTLAIGEDLDRYQRAHKVFRAYAAQFNLDFHIISEFKLKVTPNWLVKRRVRYHIEKFQLKDYFSEYERILFLDSDIFINRNCPDLFDLVPTGSVGAVYDDTNSESWKRKDELLRLEKKLGYLSIEELRYFNSGVMVLSKEHEDLFRFIRKDFISGRWPEQSLLNYRLLKERIPFTSLDSTFNFTAASDENWDQEDFRLKANIIHYAGPESKEAFDKDWPKIANLWGLKL